MKRLQSIVALFFGTFLLLVSQHQVHARNYLLWALGLEEDEASQQGQGSSHPMIRGLTNRRDNWKTRARIQETRYERREERKQVAAAADAAMEEAETLRAADDTNQHGREHNLRLKVAEKVEEEETPDVFTVGLQNSGGITRDMNLNHGRDMNIEKANARKQQNAGARAKEHGGGGNARKQKNAGARAKEHGGGGARAKEHGGGGGGKQARNNHDDGGKARKNQDNITGKQKKKQNKDHALATKRAIERAPGPGGTSLIDIGGGGKARKNNGGERKQKNDGAQRKQNGGERKQKNDGAQRKNNKNVPQQKVKNDAQRKTKNDGGQQRAKNKVNQQKTHNAQRKNAAGGGKTQRKNAAGGGGGKARNNGKQKNIIQKRNGVQQRNAHQRQNQIHYLKKLAHHRGNQQINTLEFLDRTFGIQTRSYKMNVDVGGGIARDGNGNKQAAARNGKNTNKVARDGAGDKQGGAKAKHEEVAKGRQDEEGKARKKENGGTRGGEVARERPEKNAGRAADKQGAARGRGGGGGGGGTAQQRQKENRYEKKVSNREQNQKTKKNKDDVPTDRAYNPAKGKQVAPIAVSSNVGARNNNKARNGGGGKTNPHKHKLGYNKRKQEKIQREKFLHQKKTKIDKVQLNDSGGQHVGRFGGLR